MGTAGKEKKERKKKKSLPPAAGNTAKRWLGIYAAAFLAVWACGALGRVLFGFL